MTRQEWASNRRARRMAEEIARETPEERRARLLMNLEIAGANPRWAPQAEMLLAELAKSVKP